MESNSNSQFSLPVTPQPKGMRFFFGTVTGCLIVINSVIFVLMAIESGSVAQFSAEVLIKYGAKEPVLIAAGEVWRLFTPIFVHNGIIHFGFNIFALYVLAYQLEVLLKPRWFLFLYLISGISGNVASSVFSVALSVGASGALFGLLGSGLYIEQVVGNYIKRHTGSKPRRGMYTGMVVANIILGIIIPVIDNAAHIGGLVAGIAITMALMRTMPNRIQSMSKMVGFGVAALLAGFLVFGYSLSSSSTFIKERFLEKVEESSNSQEKLYYLNQVIRLDPDDFRVKFKIAKILLLMGQYLAAKDSFREISEIPELRVEIELLQRELLEAGNINASVWLRQFTEMGN